MGERLRPGAVLMAGAIEFSPEDVQITVTEVGVNMVDHGQDVTDAYRIEPGETVESLVRRTLAVHDGWRARERGSYMTIRLVPPANRQPQATPEPDDVDPF